jgi:nucleoside-diphosphate-sugar epimerase
VTRIAITGADGFVGSHLAARLPPAGRFGLRDLRWWPE